MGKFRTEYMKQIRLKVPENLRKPAFHSVIIMLRVADIFRKNITFHILNCKRTI